MIFTAETTEPESLGFQFDFYVNQEGVTPKHIGYCYLLPVDLKKSNDTKTVPITGLNHKPIGQIDLDYLTVKPVPGLDLKMDVSYQTIGSLSASPWMSAIGEWARHTSTKSWQQ